MDFQSPPCVLNALAERVQHGNFGYSNLDEAYFSVLQNWFGERFGWRIEREWLVCAPGVVNAIVIAINAYTEKGEGVLIQQPVYYPFESSIKQTERKLLVNELVYSGGKYGIDFEDFENKAKQAKLFVMCNPHNPVGRVWNSDELMQMGEICLKYGVIVLSDEIHQDFIFPGFRHLVFAGLDPRFQGITVTCTSPTKTFNLAGLQVSNTFISNKTLNAAFKKKFASCGLSQPGIMGLIACKAAYEGGAEWLGELLVYLENNASFMREYLRAHIPKINMIELEGTYLAWLDCRAFGLPSNKLDEIILHKAKLWLNNGPMFGQGGEGFQRINFACPRSVLSEALERLGKAFE
jgi:cystathionine beta-lyase